MLRHLYIKNYALIDELDIDFYSGFSVITGETGAGKSIILGAIGLLLGQRADSKVVKSEQLKCIIEATFSIDGTEHIMRRELTSAGKSRSFIDDELSTLQEMREFGERLLDVHSQHQNLLLQKEDFQLSVLDIIAGNDIVPYKAAYKAYLDAEQQLRDMIAADSQAHQDEELMRFQLDELSKANLDADEQESLEEEQETASHAEDIKSLLFEAGSILSTDESGVVDLLRLASHRIASASQLSSRLTEVSDRLESSYIELKDIAAVLEDELDNVNFDPERMAYINERLDLIYSLQKKHGVSTVGELLEKQEQLQQIIDSLDNSGEEIEAQKVQVEQLRAEAEQLADALSASRKKAVSSVEKSIVARLADLGMPSIVFSVNIQEKKLSHDGKDKVEFLFSANKGMPMRPVTQVASGGEIARLMLALKALISGAVKLPTIIFDEIDTGVSGRIAEQMALIMREMGDKERQVISITHLPQIAARGTHHYRVEKHETPAGTTTSIMRQLSNEEREREIAQMLSGADVSAAALENAKELLWK